MEINWKAVWGVLATMFIVGVAILIVLAGNKIADEKKSLKDDCVPTDLRVYVGGYVNKELTIYDCSDTEE